MPAVSCPGCGESEYLRGERGPDDIIEIVCERCGLRFERDTERRCALCGSTDLKFTPKPLWEKGRGEQRTPAGKIPAYACYDCGGRDVTSANPRPAD